ncbi:MAG TPA: DNA mismatch repair protein MutS [Clostridia bacterium]|nr:DNA mismatch repair protein MutS [Clostridia bacterium]
MSEDKNISAKLTPMMQQYLTLKEKHADCLLLFRLGDFYELFFEDAVTASRELEITLTGRDCGLSERAPMCGVPYHAVDTYINKLIEKGYKVAICEQLTDPALSKGLVERDIIRIITPGTVIEESMLSERKNNYIASIFFQDADVGLAYCDVSTGVFYALSLGGEGREDELTSELARIQASEVIANDALFMQEHLIKSIQSSSYTACYSNDAYLPATAEGTLSSHFGADGIKAIEEQPLALCASGALLSYLEETQKNALAHIKKIELFERSKFMSIDAATRKNLELTQPIRTDAGKRATLLFLLDKTCTAMGGRLLRTWVEQPLQSAYEIGQRLDAVEELVKKPVERSALIKSLDSVYDIERLCSRIAYGTVNARDCEALRVSLSRLPNIIAVLTKLSALEFENAAAALDPMEDIYSLLASAIVDGPPLSVKEGGIIRDGYNAEVDAYRDASRNGKEWLSKLEAREREATGIKNLKIGYNHVFGYYIEVTKSYQQLVPYSYQRKQTLANCERYVNQELKELEETILGAEEKCVALEYKLFTELRETLLGCIARLQLNAALLSKLDAYQSFAQVAFANDYCRPLVQQNGKIEITDGRHPVVERSLKAGFIPNNTLLDNKDNRLLIITGPNMAGKSTYMRQVALITLMAHIGSFVPAKKASICITDKIFTRVGSSDNVSAGQSTFMVEMSEMSNILNNATPRSLLIIDEIGRGTSTFDGLSIAWSVLEYVASREKCGAKTLFATHYHELTELEGKLTGIKNYRISVKEIGDNIIFLRKIVRGSADKSFGIQVARLAGLPESILSRAKEILSKLESADINHEAILGDNDPPQQLTLFGSAEPDDIMEELKNLSVDDITPMDALTKLYDLHVRAKLR